MLVASQLPIQTTKIFYSFFDVHCASHFVKSSSTTNSNFNLISENWVALNEILT